MNYLAQVQRGIDYIEAHLDGDLDPADVARHAGLSQWHYQRIFKALTNETLKTYIRSRRFSLSLEKLARTQERVLDIALASGFESQESFTRAFKKAFSVTPAHYRRHAGALAFLHKVRFDEDYLRHIHANVSLEPEFIEHGEMQLVGLSTKFHGMDSEKNNVASKLPALWAAFLPLLADVPNRIVGSCHGVVQQTSAQSDELVYWAAAPVTHVGPLGKGLASLRIPAARYARFTHRGLPAGLDQTVNYIYSSWLLRSGERHAGGCDLEFYGADYAADSHASTMHYAIPLAAN